MKISRREWMSRASGTALALAFVRRAAAQDGETADRITQLIGEFEAQGFHRTGTDVDRASGLWLSEQVRRTGLSPAEEPFTLERVDPITGTLTVAGRRIEGLPLYDGAFTDATGIRGRLSHPDASAEIALVETAVNAAGGGALGTLRRANRHKAIVAVTRGARPGLAPSNADAFLKPFGPPVLQVSSEEGGWLGEQAQRGADVQLIAHVTRTPATATNVTTRIEGTGGELPPFVVMTPRSGWYWCASERGGGIACWLEIMRALRSAPLRRPVLFVASSGHELGHLGIDAYIARRPAVVPSAAGWLHLGANIGAAINPGITLQASSDDLDALVSRELTANGLMVTRRTPRGAVPGGEAEAVHRGGGRYVSTIGGNGLFHTLDDRGPQAIDAAAIARFSAAFTAVVRTAAQ